MPHYDDACCIKQQLSNIWSSIHEKVKKYWDWVKESVGYIKKCTLGIPELSKETVCYS